MKNETRAAVFGVLATILQIFGCAMLITSHTEDGIAALVFAIYCLLRQNQNMKGVL